LDLRTFDAQYPSPVLGIDEVGLGCIAGPLYAAGVVLPEDDLILSTLMKMGVNDSKRVAESTRDRVYEYLATQHVHFVVESMTVPELERHGIYNSVDILFRRIVRAFRETACPKTILIDGSERKNLNVRHISVVKGDSRSLAIAAASIVAKVERDRYMVALDQEFPRYGWCNNKGYPTLEHKVALDEYGVTAHHRRMTKPVKRLLKRGSSFDRGDLKHRAPLKTRALASALRPIRDKLKTAEGVVSVSLTERLLEVYEKK